VTTAVVRTARVRTLVELVRGVRAAMTDEGRLAGQLARAVVTQVGDAAVA
jgi:hypothetical protein